MDALRQGLQRYLTPEQLARVAGVRVGLAGAGGLGSNCAQMLVRSGFTDLVVADFDRVEASNLNRQFFFADQVGQPKVAALRDNLLRIAPDVRVEALEREITADNALDTFAGCHVLVEALDGAAAKRMLAETFLAARPEVFLVAASGLGGCGDADRIRTHRIKDNFYMVGDLVSGAGPDCPPLAPCVTVAAAKQADLVLARALGRIA